MRLGPPCELQLPPTCQSVPACECMSSRWLARHIWDPNPRSRGQGVCGRDGGEDTSSPAAGGSASTQHARATPPSIPAQWPRMNASSTMGHTQPVKPSSLLPSPMAPWRVRRKRAISTSLSPAPVPLEGVLGSRGTTPRGTTLHFL